MTTDALPHTDRRSPSPPTDRVVAIMQLLGRSPQRAYSLAEIERTLGISRATAHAILSALVGHDWIVRDHRSGHYSWGPAIAALARPAGATTRRIRTRLGELAGSIDGQVVLFEPRGEALVAIDTIGSAPDTSPVTTGFTVPLVAPFGREFIAFAPPESQQAWLDRVGPTQPAFDTRITRVLEQVRSRGYAIERRSNAFSRVFAAMHVLSGEIDAITERLAGAVAELTVVDFLDDELVDGPDHTVATVSAPIFAPPGTVALTLTAIVVRPLSADAVAALGTEIRYAATEVGELLATYGDV
ncbi:helix-turn-helix domain-containing protein [Nocardia rhamnosiphila]|uniref:IclR family transcriptional regulator n=1 Tax=Nocardia rhamnosiphila TaxID=426716 RepID=UPI0033C46B5C